MWKKEEGGSISLVTNKPEALDTKVWKMKTSKNLFVDYDLRMKERRFNTEEWNDVWTNDTQARGTMLWDEWKKPEDFKQGQELKKTGCWEEVKKLIVDEVMLHSVMAVWLAGCV